MITKLNFVQSSAPAPTSGSDEFNYLAQGGHSPASIDQNFANLRANLDKLGGHEASQAPGANQIPVLDSSGNLKLGSTTGNYHIFAKSASSGFVAKIANSGGATPYGLYIDYESVDGTGGVFLQCHDIGATRFQVLGSGNVQNVNNSYGAISDLKLKENVTAARSYLDDLCAVRVVKYSLIADASPTATHLGVIAQELEQIFPGMVEEVPDMAERQLSIDGVPQVDGDGKPVMEIFNLGTTTKSVKYSVFVPMLITAVQELKAICDSLEARLVVLEAAQ